MAWPWHGHLTWQWHGNGMATTWQEHGKGMARQQRDDTNMATAWQ
jgi:hypothetical protein